ncbi:DUF7344 domain-containing protein [Haloferax elongans]
MTVSTIAEEVAARENNCTVAELTSTQRKRVYISLEQNHLVTMDGIIDYNDDKKR